ncbi:MAG: plastocyanin/azurin family copper-binding protein [Actinomycetota bacterium]
MGSRSLRNPVTWVLVAIVAVAALVLLPQSSRGAKAKFSGSCGGAGCVWTPKVRRIHKGDKIVWKVPVGDTTHTVTARAKGHAWKKDVTLSPGEKTSKVFRKKGRYFFKCTIHDGMNGRVRVRA